MSVPSPRSLVPPGLALAAVLLALPAGTHAASARTCEDVLGEGATPFQITASGTSCSAARKLASRVSKVRGARFRGCSYVSGRELKLTSPCVRSGYRCRTTARVGDTIRVRCVRGGRTVRFRM
ncbi:hypothetical protein [Patulibacter minatonensis]|uniref:hypothetical protein n=1 Tax=Patulibacter minatonensis TaxID=298163 RepID=UPI00047D075B|nr:hypothetical protein [Patulibacter minatonensis]